jgi:lipopolysaccharide/colanic/teichoic acid biosynthesis glycosyltransferase/GGDEF domain-containing protein
MLKRIFSRKNHKHSDNFFRAEFDGFLLDSEDFLDRMRQERMRSERYETPLSLVTIDIPALAKFSTIGNGKKAQTFMRHIAGVLKNSTRESDIKGWYQENKIGLLAPNTNELGARGLASNLIQSAMNYSGLGGNLETTDLNRFVLVSSIETGRSYLANGQDLNNKKTSSPSSKKQDFVEFTGAESLPSRTSVATGSVDLAVAEWPLSIEILSQELARELDLKVKRFIDIVGSLVGIILCAPLMLIIALLIKLTSRGPVLFRQERLGFLGKPFTFLKFRSMKAASDQSLHKDYVTKLINGDNDAINKGTADQPLYKITEDPRITPFGKFLRKSSLDELPQFFNVLKGNMSLVGPRPPIPYECDVYKRWHCRRVLEVKPGITGLWQVSGRSSTTFDEMVRLDLAYIRNWSLWLDIKIIFQTFWAVVSTKGGY